MFEHFLKYQNGEINGCPSFKKALHEITVNKKKLSHWIWYIVPYDFPSLTHQDLFVLQERNVKFYIENHTLRNNYIDIMNAIYILLRNTDIYKFDTIISRTDLKKIYGSATLFKNNIDPSENKIINICQKIIVLLDLYNTHRKLK